ncbi:MAG TPA: hypothetical protein PKN29_13585 [Candidatus Ozemobacteraceae bacterium]|nr:hypothetical protein [Candidatus Ozemobacteraceae bacterium]
MKLPADCDVVWPCYNRFPGRNAPLGLLCLAAVEPQRIATLDAPTSQSLIDCLASYSSEAIRAVFLQRSDKTDPEKARVFSQRVREFLPKTSVGVNVEKAEVPDWADFAVNGTGKSAVLRILRGDRLTGFIDHRHDDDLSPLPVPEEAFIDCGYDIHPEKWLAGTTLEVCQPWQGLHDMSAGRRSWPGLDWVSRLVSWLKASGIAAFHFRPSGLNCDDLHELRSLLLNQKARFAVSFAADDEINIRQIGWPLQQVWLYYPTRSSAEKMREHLQQIHDAGFQAGLHVNSAWLSCQGHGCMAGLADRLAIIDDGLWPAGELRRLVVRYWGGKNRFFRRLFSLKSASELVMFMKTSYFLLETLFSSEEEGGKR